MLQANHDDTTPTLRQLLYTHEKLENLARGDLSRPVIAQIIATASGLVVEIGKTPAQSWDEFHRKLGVLLDDHADSTSFMDVLGEDIARLAGVMPEMAQAAE
jgi:hypothetical protein